MVEDWRPVVGHPSYDASDLGRVRGRKYGRWLRTEAPIILQGTLSRGYRLVHIAGKKIGVAKLVLEAFVGPCPEGMECCHGPNGKSDDSLNNLYYGTHAQNMGADRRRDGTSGIGENNSGSKLTNEEALEIAGLLRKGMRGVDIAEMYGVTKGLISLISKGLAWGDITGISRSEQKRKLTEDEVIEVLILRSLGLKQKEIAERLNCTQPNISCILGGRTWIHVTGIGMMEPFPTSEIIEDMRWMLSNGWPLKEIAKHFYVSVGLVIKMTRHA